MPHNTFDAPSASATCEPALPGIADRLLRSRLLAGAEDGFWWTFTSYTTTARFADTATGSAIAAHL